MHVEQSPRRRLSDRFSDDVDIVWLATRLDDHGRRLDRVELTGQAILDRLEVNNRGLLDRLEANHPAAVTMRLDDYGRRLGALELAEQANTAFRNRITGALALISVVGVANLCGLAALLLKVHIP